MTSSAFWGKIFGTKKGHEPTPQEAVQKLRETEDLLMKKTDFLETKIQAELATARKHGVKNKRAALQALKRKKMYEQQLVRVDGTLSTLEYQRETLENAVSNTETLTAMSHAAQALKAAHKNMNADQVHDMMDDIAEQADMIKEITDIIATPSGFGFETYDDDELLAELEELEQEDLRDELADIAQPSIDALPDVPPVAPKRLKNKQSKKKDSVDDELAELEAWAVAS